MRPSFAALGLTLLLVAVAFAIPAPAARAADLTGMYGGTLRMALLAAPSWNPLSTNPTDIGPHNLVWDTLARPDAVTGEPKPWAALSWTSDSVAKTITVTPRAGLTWSTGTAITNADLVRTFTQYGFVVSASGSNLVFSFPSGNQGKFFSEALYGWIAWDAAGTQRYSGMFDRASPTQLNANTHFWAGRPYLDSVILVVASSVDDAACRLLKNRAVPAVAGTVDLIGFGLLPNDLTDERACTAYGGFRDPLGNPLNKSLVNANATRAEPHVSAVHHPGPRLMYYWIDVAAGGVMGDVAFRRAMYLLVNKQSAALIEPSSRVTHSLISRSDTFWFLSSWEVVRDAGFTTIRDPAGTPRQDTNPFAGAQALDNAGYLDRDGDGWRQTPTGAAFTVRIGSLGFLNSPDPRKATIAGAYVDVLQRQGVNAVHVQFTSWADLRNAETTGAVDVALETYDPGMANPRWMETFQPIIDANDANTITHLGLGKNAWTLADRQLHFNHVTYYNSLCACALPVLSYETLEAFDRTSFSGWVDSFGGINNVWSFAALQQPQLGPLTIALSTFSKSVTSGSTTTVQVVVSDNGGGAVQGAAISLAATIGTLTDLTGATDANGRFQTTWTAPLVNEDTDVTVTATVSKPQYVGGVVWTGITAHAPFRPLDVAVTLGQSVLGAGNTTSVQVLVTTSGGAPVANAAVSLTVSLPGGRLTSSSGATNAAGIFTTSFTASPSVRSIYRIDVMASRAGFSAGSGAGSVIVTPAPNVPSDYKHVSTTIPGFEALAVIGAIGAAVAVLRWRSRREG